MEVRWRISGRCKNVTRHKFGGIFGHVMTKISLSKVTIRSYLGLSGGSPPDARNPVLRQAQVQAMYDAYVGCI